MEPPASASWRTAADAPSPECDRGRLLRRPAAAPLRERAPECRDGRDAAASVEGGGQLVVDREGPVGVPPDDDRRVAVTIRRRHGRVDQRDVEPAVAVDVGKADCAETRAADALEIAAADRRHDLHAIAREHDERAVVDVRELSGRARWIAHRHDVERRRSRADAERLRTFDGDRAAGERRQRRVSARFVGRERAVVEPGDLRRARCRDQRDAKRERRDMRPRGAYRSGSRGSAGHCSGGRTTSNRGRAVPPACSRSPG